jgi:hypothetical protein
MARMYRFDLLSNDLDRRGRHMWKLFWIELGSRKKVALPTPLTMIIYFSKFENVFECVLPIFVFNLIIIS